LGYFLGYFNYPLYKNTAFSYIGDKVIHVVTHFTGTFTQMLQSTLTSIFSEVPFMNDLRRDGTPIATIATGAVVVPGEVANMCAVFR